MPGLEDLFVSVSTIRIDNNSANFTSYLYLCNR